MKVIEEEEEGHIRIEAYPENYSQTADYIAIVTGEGKEDIYFTNRMSPFGTVYLETPSKYIRTEKDRLVLYSKIKEGNLEIYEKKTGREDRVYRGKFSTSPE